MTALARTLQSRNHEIFMCLPDTEPFVRAAGLTFLPCCESEFPVDSVDEYVRGIGTLSVSTFCANFTGMRLVRTILFTLSMSLVTPTILAKMPAPRLVEPGVLPPTKNVLVFGQKIVYYDVGSGPTVVLLHGLASQAMFDWGHVIVPLS